MHDIFISCFLLVLWFACAKTMPSQLQGRFRRPGLRPPGGGPRGPRRPGPGPASGDRAAAGRVRGGLGSGPLAGLGSAAPFSLMRFGPPYKPACAKMQKTKFRRTGTQQKNITYPKETKIQKSKNAKIQKYKI